MNKTQKWFALAATFIFISLTFLPIVQSETQNETNQKDKKLVCIKCNLFGFEENQETVKELPIEIVDKLFLIIKNIENAVLTIRDKDSSILNKKNAETSIDKEINELKAYGLISKNINSEKIKKIILGQRSESILQKTKDKNPQLTSNGILTALFNKSDYKENILCFVSGYSPWAILRYPIFESLFRGYKNILESISPPVTPRPKGPAYITPLGLLIAFLNFILVEAPLMIYQYDFPKIIRPITSIYFPSTRDYYNSVHTIGLLGNWKAENNSINLVIGFTGLWFNIMYDNPYYEAWSLWCCIGSALYVRSGPYTWQRPKNFN